jgi:hypothetical protein
MYLGGTKMKKLIALLKNLFIKTKNEHKNYEPIIPIIPIGNFKYNEKDPSFGFGTFYFNPNDFITLQQMVVELQPYNNEYEGCVIVRPKTLHAFCILTDAVSALFHKEVK